MLARCPRCAQRFGVVGSGQTACPFCGARVEVRVQRLVGAPQAAHAGQGGPSDASAGSMFETLPPDAPADKISGAGPGGDPEPPPPPPSAPRLGPPRARRLFLQPAEFFARLERGRPRLRPVAGAALLVAGGAVQGASFASFLPHAPRPELGAVLGATLAVAWLLFLVPVYRFVLRAAGVPSELDRRVWPVIGYGFVPMALALVPYGGLPAALGTSMAAHSRGLEHYLGLSSAAAQATVLGTWVTYAVCAIALLSRVPG